MQKKVFFLLTTVLCVALKADVLDVEDVQSVRSPVVVITDQDLFTPPGTVNLPVGEILLEALNQSVVSISLGDFVDQGNPSGNTIINHFVNRGRTFTTHVSNNILIQGSTSNIQLKKTGKGDFIWMIEGENSITFSPLESSRKRHKVHGAALWNSAQVNDVIDQDLIISGKIILPARETKIEALHKDVTVYFQNRPCLIGSNDGQSVLNLIAHGDHTITLVVDRKISWKGSTPNHHKLIIKQTGSGNISINILEN